MILSKYHGCGNSFIIGLYKDGINYSTLAKKICNKDIGIGADGMILCKGHSPFEMVFYNADGTQGPMCGNGIRCMCAYLRDNGYEKNDIITIKTLSGTRKVKCEENHYEVNMGKPYFDPILLDIRNKEVIINKKMEFQNVEYICNAIYMTTHHLVILVDNVNISNETGNFFCTNELFKKGINVNFVKVIDQDNIIVHTYERGVGWTKACGSGSCASYVILKRERLINDKVTVHFEYGELLISQIDNDIIMKGPVDCISRNISVDDNSIL